MAGAVLAVLACLRWQEPGAIAMICGGVLYVVGMFAVTIVFNVPLNDQLAAADPASSAAAPVWALPDRMDILESPADGRVDRGDGAIHRGHCRAIGGGLRLAAGSRAPAGESGPAGFGVPRTSRACHNGAGGR
ncbi:DUF1772 domain-containing protein [Bradyrhizobium sp. ISRA443]|uniref:anthrone oxygenase family protein n=1 Tax=unclassified Bradyrhizobium TaxID=2631580 RepID=UPI00247A3366|nr:MULTISPECIES: anthrone oxygenase family protein [unclassified Bradyrhizobium]WGR92198.1 DUF1772 domain-containing protein [Bradyrhizobium sp. ISRA435]WGR96476.1 DUF1772 domain-containing protein [Bradyrhizobium sp. ISRA436]WGS03363.1 DUF1772 domain-containing protein [Bradyrhizobium sp. ISRA437]WGS10247.1 DUF1772 domain-containing protein [Bradyrhizobium sp. ISRA443]